MLEITPTKSQVKKAKKILDENPDGYNSRSYRNGGIAFLSGKLAEICFGDYFGAKHVDDINYDFIYKGKKIEIKTKACSDYRPRENWYCSIPAYFDQQTDYYVFARVNKALTKVWFVGYIEKQSFLKKASFVKEGEKDPDSSPQKIWTCPTDSYYIKIKNLKKFELK